MTHEGTSATTTGSPHLTLAELAAGEDSGDLSASAAGHLRICAACQARSRRLIPDGVRLLVSGCQPPVSLMQAVLAAIDAQPASLRRSRLAGPKGASRVALISAAAAVLLGAAAVGAATALRPARHPQPGSAATVAAGLTATGCSGLELAGGTLQRVSGTDLVLVTPGGHQVTVTTSPGTHILRLVAGNQGDVTDGAQVLVSGTVTAGTIAARQVGILPLAPGASVPHGDAAPQLGLAAGTVTAASGTAFTVVEQDGTRVPVTMSSSTTVIMTVAASLSQLQPGKITSAAGTEGPGGTLAATTVEQDALQSGSLHAIPLVPPSLPSGQPSPLRTPLPSPHLSGSLPTALPSPGSLPSRVPGLGVPIASLGCAADVITSADLLTLSS